MNTSLTPPQADFTPGLTSLQGDGLCLGNAGFPTMYTVNLDFSSTGGVSCLGGAENMGGNVTFGSSPALSEPGVSVIAVGGPGVLHLTMYQLTTGFVAVADLVWPDTRCSGSSSTFDASTTGTMSYGSE